MKPPPLKVAVLWNRDVLRFQCEAPLTVVSAANSRRVDSSSEVSFRLVSSRAAKRISWLWLGCTSQEDGATLIPKGFKSGELVTRSWPVGLNPVGSGWTAREHRFLVCPVEESGDINDLYTKLKNLRPDLQAEFLSLPEGDESGIVVMKEGGVETEINLPVLLHSIGDLSCPEAPVGEGFHWEHTETLKMSSPVWVALGADGKLCAGVDISVEDYLASVNSSEMPADSPLEFLKSQVVAARSWLLANWGSHHLGEPYTICNGDHCQCFYGPERIQEASRRAVVETSGQVLLHQGGICDARYAKACGGVMEPASNVWAFAGQPYLGPFRDLPDAPDLDLSAEADFREFQQRHNPEDACCSPGFAPLEGKLQSLAGLYRWNETITAQALTEIIHRKTGVSVGALLELKPGCRGPSGRLIDLEVIGSDDSLKLSPELTIRRALSSTHLPSSAFWLERHGDEFTFHGLGWGHGVGLCQIGAAALAGKGWNYSRILEHYYRGAELAILY